MLRLGWRVHTEMNPSASVIWFDFETDLSHPGYRIPQPAILTTYSEALGARLWLTRELATVLEQILDAVLASPKPAYFSPDGVTYRPAEPGCLYLGGQNVATFDCPVIAQWYPWLRAKLWRAFEEGRIIDTMIAERGIQIQRGMPGELSQSALARKYGVPFADKDDPAVQAIRMSFGQYIGAEHIPYEHAAYALGDPTALPAIFDRQMATGLVDLWDVAELGRQQFALALVSARGFRTDPAHVAKLEAMVAERIGMLEEIARECGFLRTSAKGEVSRNMAAIHEAIARDYAPDIWDGLTQWRADARAAWLAHRGPVKRALPKDWAAKAEKWYAETHPAPDPWADPRIPKTGAGNVRADRLTMTDASDERLNALAEWGQLLAIRNKDLPLFLQGAVEPVHSRFTILDTTRSGSSPNQQNFGKLPGVRECIKARDGHAIASSDYKMLELVALAQLIVERLDLHTMSAKLNAGVDMHAEIGADVIGETYEYVMAHKKTDKRVEEARDCGKPANFGLNGGMRSAETFALYARKSYGQDLETRLPGESVQDWQRRRVAKAERIMQAWRDRAHDQQAYLAAIRSTKNEIGLYDMALPRFRNLWRHNLRYTEAANNPFQILGMRIAIRGLWYVIREQYLPGGELNGSHVVMFVHDDVSSETPLHLVAQHVPIQERLLARASREIAPAVFTGVESKVLSHLSKGAHATRDTDGALTVTAVEMPVRIGRKLET